MKKNILALMMFIAGIGNISAQDIIGKWYSVEESSDGASGVWTYEMYENGDFKNTVTAELTIEVAEIKASASYSGKYLIDGKSFIVNSNSNSIKIDVTVEWVQQIKDAIAANPQLKAQLKQTEEQAKREFRQKMERELKLAAAKGICHQITRLNDNEFHYISRDGTRSYRTREKMNVQEYRKYVNRVKRGDDD